MQKIKAFTLFELLITISISTLLVGFAFKAYLNFSQISGLANEHIDKTEERDAFLYALENDVLKAQYIYKKAKGLYFMAEHDSVKYSLETNGIIRSSALIDSFDLPDYNFQFAFQNKDLINLIQVRIPQTRDSLDYSFGKRYSALDLLDWERRENEN